MSDYDGPKQAFLRDCERDGLGHVYDHLMSMRNAMRTLSERIARLEKAGSDAPDQRRVIKLECNLPDDLVAQLRSEAEGQGVTVHELMRQTVEKMGAGK